jgi:hypothetical protein
MEVDLAARTKAECEATGASALFVDEFSFAGYQKTLTVTPSPSASSPETVTDVSVLAVMLIGFAGYVFAWFSSRRIG